MKNLTLGNIAQACGGVYHGTEEKKGECVTSITSDSRKVEEGCLFVPIVGARADGHDFILQVMEAGALCTFSERELEGAKYPYIQVGSTLTAVKDLAAYYLEQLQIPVVGITGSVGKTSTKEMIAAVLSQRYRVLKTQGNFNNELGLPLTVFRLRDEDEIAVLEMGISDFDEMHRLAAIAKPNTCVITNIGTCHLENLGDRDGVLKAKTEVFDHLKDQATVILNGDDDKLATVKEVQGRSPVFFGLDPEHPIYADEIKGQGIRGISCKIHTPEGEFAVTVPIPGQHMVYNALAGTAVGLTYGMTLEEIKTGIESVKPLGGRLNFIINEKLTIIDDCYNANPMSMKASVGILADVLERKVAILGDMGELGADEAKLHAEVGTFVGKSKIDLLICAGPLCKNMAEAAVKAAAQEAGKGTAEGSAGASADETEGTKLQVVYFEDREKMMEGLPGLIKAGDVVLVKASHFMCFEEVVKELRGYCL
ncbi:MAG: UDP-N-acetylmuramoyl-tripeptide--D-alanyl-D-alanine ligase [Clostridia bacterium]|nr:UDP-N-acetylmuramoyl-tripeptide--D-alanyl-D-alanine ligase [Clostridia bacterium]NCC42281.1 UDP-N-acetylmuramoyl-tripeptide--D-alanyl-D-alanine ligase [Clostridia bacterium]